MQSCIEQTPESQTIVERIMDRFAGDTNAILSNLAANGIVFGVLSDAVWEEKGDTVKNEAPQEWIERQEEERRAWAVTTAVEFARAHDRQMDVVGLAKQITEFVIGDVDKDLNDVEATDLFYLIMGQKIETNLKLDELFYDETEESAIAEFLIDCVDELAKNGVRLKDGKRLPLGPA